MSRRAVAANDSSCAARCSADRWHTCRRHHRAGTTSRLAAREAHPAAVPAPNQSQRMPGNDPRLWWSLSFAVPVATWAEVGGFCEQSSATGAKIDFGFAARAADVEFNGMAAPTPTTSGIPPSHRRSTISTTSSATERSSPAVGVDGRWRGGSTPSATGDSSGGMSRPDATSVPNQSRPDQSRKDRHDENRRPGPPPSSDLRPVPRWHRDAHGRRGERAGPSWSRRHPVREGGQPHRTGNWLRWFPRTSRSDR